MTDGYLRALHLSDMSVTEDARLVGLARSGVPSAFDELFRRHSRPVHALAYHMLGDRDAADDVVQEVFVRVHRGLAGFRGKCSLRGWILRIAVNECTSHHRRLRRQERQRSELREAALLVERAASGLCTEVLTRALQLLRPVERALVVMRDVQGYTYEEMGEIMGCSARSIGVRLHRARGKLRQACERLSREECE